MATHTHIIVIFFFSHSSVLSCLLDSKAPQGRCWPHLSSITPTSVYNTITSAEGLPQGICLAQQLCMQKTIFTDRQRIYTVNSLTKINKDRDDNSTCYFWTHILWCFKWKHNNIYRDLGHLLFSPKTLVSFMYNLNKLKINPWKIIISIIVTKMFKFCVFPACLLCLTDIWRDSINRAFIVTASGRFTVMDHFRKPSSYSLIFRKYELSQWLKERKTLIEHYVY